jgi:hypothetical protein
MNSTCRIRLNLPPLVQHPINVLAHSVTRLDPIPSFHQQPIVAGVSVANGCDHGRTQRVFVQGSPRGGSTYSAAATNGRMRRNHCCFFGRAAGKHLVDRFRHSHSERQILFVTIHLRSFTLRAAFVSVGQAFLLGSVQSHFLDQYALSFVAFASPAEANHHGGKSAVPSGPSGKSGVPSGQVNQMIEIGTGEQSCRWPSLKRKSPPTSCFPQSAHFDSRTRSNTTRSFASGVC